MTLSIEELANGVWIERCGKHRVLHLTNATAATAATGLIVTLASTDYPYRAFHGAVSIKNSQSPNLYIAVGADGKVQLFNAGSLQSVTSSVIATIDWYVY